MHSNPAEFEHLYPIEMNHPSVSLIKKYRTRWYVRDVFLSTSIIILEFFLRHILARPLPTI